METYRTFNNLQSAKDYRYQQGTGGWIFEPESGPVILFPPTYSPAGIFNHTFTKGKSGKLHANA
jgi:hypothetical protein